MCQKKEQTGTKLIRHTTVAFSVSLIMGHGRVPE